MSKTYTHLSLEERALIQIWLEPRLSIRRPFGPTRALADG